MTEREQLRAEYRRSSLRQMGDRRGVSWQAMQQRLKKAGVRLRSRGGDCRRFSSSRRATERVS